MRDRERERRRDRGIDGVAAAREHRRACIAGWRRDAHDETLLRGHAEIGLRPPGRRDGKNRNEYDQTLLGHEVSASTH